MFKPVFRMYIYVILFQSIVYGLIFYIFETISISDNPTQFMVFWVPVIFSVFVSFLLVRTMTTRIRKNGVDNLNYKNFIVSCIRTLSPPLLSKDALRKQIEKDAILDDCELVDDQDNEHLMLLKIRYSFFLEEIIFIDFKEMTLKLCSKPTIWYVYGPYGGGIQKIGYLEAIIENHYNKKKKKPLF